MPMPRPLFDLMNPRRLTFYALIPAAALLLAPALARAADEKVTYQDHALPLFRNNCLGCHNPDKKKAGLDLSSFTATLAGSNNGQVIAPGDPEGSLLYRLVMHTEEPFMPPNRPKLGDKELDVFKKWITDGLLENAGAKAIAATWRAHAPTATSMPSANHFDRKSDAPLRSGCFQSTSAAAHAPRCL